MLTVQGVSDVGFEQVRQLWSKRSKWMVLTGAGISTACGIPDYRSKQGLKHQTLRTSLQSMDSALLRRLDHDETVYFDPLGSGIFDGLSDDLLDQQSTTIFSRNIANTKEQWIVLHRFCGLLRETLYQSSNCPSSFHKLIGQLRTDGRLMHWLTQNIDGIEAYVGCRMLVNPKAHPAEYDVVQMHGGVNTVWCTKSAHMQVIRPSLGNQLLRGEITPCMECSTESLRGRPYAPGVWRPGILLYDDDHPNAVHMGETVKEVVSWDLAHGADALLIAGTSLQNVGVSRLIRDIKANIQARHPKHESNLCVLLVNKTPPPAQVQKLIDIFVQMSCEEFADVMQEMDGQVVEVQQMAVHDEDDWRTLDRDVLARLMG